MDYFVSGVDLMVVLVLLIPCKVPILTVRSPILQVISKVKKERIEW